MIDRTVSFEETMELLDKAVMDRGQEWVYPSVSALGLDESGEELGATCVYFNDPNDLMPRDIEILEQHGVFQGSPACLVGEVFHRLGLTADDLEDDMNGIGVAEFKERSVISFEDHAWNLLEFVQACQDMGIPWGDAVEAAKSIPTERSWMNPQALLTQAGWKCVDGKWIKPE